MARPMHRAPGMPQQHETPGPARPIYPVPLIEAAEVPATVKVVWLAGRHFADVGGRWRLVDETSGLVRETDD